MAIFNSIRCRKEIQSLEMRRLPRQGHVLDVENSKVTGNDYIWLVRKFYVKSLFVCFLFYFTFVNKEIESKK